MKKLILPVAIACSLAASLLLGKAFGQSSMVNVASSSAPFLQISPDARTGSMGDAGIALSPDANATFWNNAKASFSSRKSSVSANYIPWLSDLTDNVFLASVGGYYKTAESSAITGGVRYFDMGNINLTNDGTTILGSQHPRQFSVEAGYSQQVSKYFGVGVSLRYINSNLIQGTYNGKGYSTANAVAGDISAFYSHVDTSGAGLSAGLTISNIGSKMSYTNSSDSKYFLPANIGIGMSYTWAFDEDNRLTLSADGNHLSVPILDSSNEQEFYDKGVISGIGSSFSNKAWSAAGGIEYSYNNQFFARAGYHWETKGAGDIKFVSGGLGVKVNDIGINLSYLFPTGNGTSRNPLSNTLRFSILFDISGKVK